MKTAAQIANDAKVRLQQQVVSMLREPTEEHVYRVKKIDSDYFDES